MCEQILYKKGSNDFDWSSYPTALRYEKFIKLGYILEKFNQWFILRSLCVNAFKGNEEKTLKFWTVGSTNRPIDPIGKMLILLW